MKRAIIMLSILLLIISCATTKNDRKETSFNVEDTRDNRESIIKDARLLPAINDGGLIGYLVTKIKDNSLFTKIGINEGDLIKEVNGNKFSKHYTALEMLRVWSTSHVVNLKIMDHESGSNKVVIIRFVKSSSELIITTPNKRLVSGRFAPSDLRRDAAPAAQA